MNFIEIEQSTKTEEWSMIDLHSHSHYEIYFLEKGNRTFFLSSELYRLSAPVLIIIPPHTLHKTEGAAFARYNINVSEDYLDDFQKHVLTKKSLVIIKLNNKENETFKDIFNQMCEVDKRQKYANSKIKSLFSYFIYLLSNIYAEKTSPNNSKEKPIPPQILKIIEYLNLHYNENITPSDISDLFYISKGALIYNFNKYINCSPIEYLLSIRLTRAKEFLQRTNKSIGEISELCGFSSANYFSLIFKQKENLSPLGYRKHQQNKL